MKEAIIPLFGMVLRGVTPAKAARAAAAVPPFGTSGGCAVRAVEHALAGSDLTIVGEMEPVHGDDRRRGLVAVELGVEKCDQAEGDARNSRRSERDDGCDRPRLNVGATNGRKRTVAATKRRTRIGRHGVLLELGRNGAAVSAAHIASATFPAC